MSNAALTLLPAVDVAGGQAVRLVHGAAGTETGYGDALQAALAWQAAGAQWVHLVDLDAAFGRGSNADLLATIVGRLDVAVELSGGIRDDASLAAALATGCARVNIGTAALEQPEWVRAAIAAHGDQIAVGLDVRGDHAVRPGLDPGRRRTGRRAGPAGRGGLRPLRGHRHQPGRHADRAQPGPAAARHRPDHRPVIASGGVSSLADLAAIATLVDAGVEGAIVGKALYAGAFTLEEALLAVAA